MSDDVWPVQDEVGSLSTFNGTGYELKGFTRTDPSGRCFATRWWVVGLNLPVLPLERYYVTQKEDYYVREGKGQAKADVWTTNYVIHGQSHLRIDEIVRTYLYSWLIAPAIGLGPFLVVLAHVERVVDARWVIFVAVLGAFFVGIFIAAALPRIYRKRWARVRTVRWVKSPRTHEDNC
ncbi:hypothetical protein OHR68_19775 [Spirillospora sp. NBC_00431]